MEQISLHIFHSKQKKEHKQLQGQSPRQSNSKETMKPNDIDYRKMQEKFDATPSLAFPGMELELTGPRKPNFTLWIGNIRGPNFEYKYDSQYITFGCGVDIHTKRYH